MGRWARKWLAAAVFLAALAAAEPGAASPESAAQFVNQFGNRAIEVLGAPGLTDADREARVRDLLRRGLDLAFIGRFVLGKHWGGATPAQQSDYLVLFEGYVVKSYAAWFARHGGERLMVVEVRQANPKDVVVATRIDRRDGQPIFAEWRVRAIAGQDRIIDISSNGISLAGNQRLEFAAVIKRHGIEGLIAFLRKRAAN